VTEPVSESMVQFADSEAPAAAVIARVDGALHTGVLYKWNKKVGAVHMRIGVPVNNVHNEWGYGGLWMAPDADDEMMYNVGLWCRRIYASFKDSKPLPFGMDPLPYALGYYGAKFIEGKKSVKLSLEQNERAQGLTCASFVLGIFKSAGIRLVEESTWVPRPEEDIDFVKTLRFSDTKLPELRPALRAEAESGIPRVRPEEVMGACCSSPLPVHFEQCREQGQRVLKILEGLPIPQRVIMTPQNVNPAGV